MPHKSRSAAPPPNFARPLPSATRVTAAQRCPAAAQVAHSAPPSRPQGSIAQLNPALATQHRPASRPPTAARQRRSAASLTLRLRLGKDPVPGRPNGAPGRCRQHSADRAAQREARPAAAVRAARSLRSASAATRRRLPLEARAGAADRAEPSLRPASAARRIATPDAISSAAHRWAMLPRRRSGGAQRATVAAARQHRPAHHRARNAAPHRQQAACGSPPAPQRCIARAPPQALRAACGAAKPQQTLAPPGQRSTAQSPAVHKAANPSTSTSPLPAGISQTQRSIAKSVWASPPQARGPGSIAAKRRRRSRVKNASPPFG